MEGRDGSVQSIRDIHVLRDGRLCVVREGPTPTLYLVAMPFLEVEVRPVTGPVHEAVNALDLPADTFLQWPTDPGVESFVKSLAAGRLSLSGFTERVISTALDRTAAQFERGIAKFITTVARDPCGRLTDRTTSYIACLQALPRGSAFTDAPTARLSALVQEVGGRGSTR